MTGMPNSNNKNVLAAIPLLARMLSEKYGLNITMGGHTAFTDGKTINLPTLPVDDPDTADLAIGYIDHEVGHVRFSDNEVVAEAMRISPFLNTVRNIFEDIRIEELMHEVFPGTRTNLAKLVKKLVIKEKFNKVDPLDPGKLVTGYLLYTLRSKVLGQTGLEELRQDTSQKLKKQYPGLHAELDAVAFDIVDAKNSDDALTLAKKVLEAVKKYIKEPPKPPTPPQSNGNGEESNDDTNSDASDGNGDGDQGEQGSEGGSGDDSNADGSDNNNSDNKGDQGSNSDSSSDDSSNADGSGQGGGSGSDKKDDSAASNGSGQGEKSEGGNGGASGDQGSENEWSKEQATTLRKAISADEKDLIEDLGDIVKEMLEQEAPSKPRSSSAGVAQAVQAETHSLSEGSVLNATNSMRVRLRSLLQAKTFNATWSARRGRKLDKNRLYRLACGDTRVFRRSSRKQELKTALHIVLDRSSSMSALDMKVANESMLAIKLALDGINQVNLGISAFPGTGRGYIPIKKHGQTINHTKIGLSPSGGTPLTETLWAVGSDMLHLKEDRKIILVITDGQPAAPDNVRAAIGGLEQAGYELIGIGINCDCVETFFKRSCVISDVNELPNALFRELEALLV